jgi:hypothetical protein
MQFLADHFVVEPARRATRAVASCSTAVVPSVVVFVTVSVLTVGMLSDPAVADGLPPEPTDRVTEVASAHLSGSSPAAADVCAYYIASGWIPADYGCAEPSQSSSPQQLSENQPGPTEVIEAFLAAQRVNDEEAAAALFANDALIADTAGRTTTGTDAVRRLIERLNGWEAGPRQANGHEVIWAESLPNWQPSAAPTDLDLLLEQEVPHYAYTQLMCAVVTDGKIHALIALATGSPRSCEPDQRSSAGAAIQPLSPASPSPPVGPPAVAGLMAILVGSGAMLRRGRQARLANDMRRRQLLTALRQAKHADMSPGSAANGEARADGVHPGSRQCLRP